MKILLAGASGLLGSAFARSAARRGHHVIGIVGRHPGPIPGLAETIRLDLRNLDHLERLVLERFPDAIVNCAAITEIPDCERDPAAARLLNVDLPAKLALLARHLFASLIHISSEQVFDGLAETYRHDSPTRATNAYAAQKLESEDRVHSMAGEFATTLRVPLLNGNSPGGERSVHERLLQLWERGQTATLFTDEIRQPCLADNAADLMVELCERNDLKGIYNWAGATPLSRYDIGLAIARHFGLPDSLLVPATRGHDPRFANRQPRLAFDLAPLPGKLKTQPLPFEQQLDSLLVPLPRRPWFNAC